MDHSHSFFFLKCEDLHSTKTCTNSTYLTDNLIVDWEILLVNEPKRENTASHIEGKDEMSNNENEKHLLML